MADDPILNHREEQTVAKARRPWSAPKVIVSEGADRASVTFKSEPSITDYTTGSSHVGS